jgi:hypothetical protein
MIIFNCAIEQIRGWLKSLTLEFVLGWGIQTCALGVDELTKHHQVMEHAEDPEMNVKEFLERLDRHNEDLDTDERVIARGSESRDATSSLP